MPAIKNGLFGRQNFGVHLLVYNVSIELRHIEEMRRKMEALINRWSFLFLQAQMLGRWDKEARYRVRREKFGKALIIPLIMDNKTRNFLLTIKRDKATVNRFFEKAACYNKN